MLNSALQQLDNTFVSESRLGSYLTPESLERFDPQAFLEGGHLLARADLVDLFAIWRRSIEFNAKRLARQAQSVLDNLPSGLLYEMLDDKLWRAAALASDVLRHPAISKNSAWLDTRALQRLFHAALSHSDEVTLEIAWGQAKRNAGGLKTFSFVADLAEVFALGRLETIRQALEIVLNGKWSVKLRVLGGGKRFDAALMSHAGRRQRYDWQRQVIASYLSPPGKIVVEEFIDVTDELAQARRRTSLLEWRHHVGRENIDRHFETVLMNVDWQNLFSEVANEKMLPFELDVPDTVRRLAATADRQRLNKLIRVGLQRLVADSASTAKIETDADAAHLQNYMRNVAFEATRMYLAAQQFDRSAQTPAAAGHIRLTVHAKRDAPHVPAIFTLGPRAGNQLSQHVVPLLTSDGALRFASLLEHHETTDFTTVHVERSETEISLEADWTTEGVPIAIAETGSNILARLKTVFKEDWH